MATNKVEIEVNANVTGSEAIDKLGQELSHTGDAAKKMGTDAASVSGGINTADTSVKGFTNTSGKLSKGLESVSTQLATAKTELLSLVGVGAGAAGIKNVADIADAYKNLEARIKLVTGESKNFDTAFEGVFQVAQRTNSAIEETGLLFTKLADAGKTLGISQTEALSLTETINQSIQLSGASAEASKASIIQLVQGLQSGILRGDEFNSIMEQSPRLAKALADGLGVGTGELRKMADQGQLTSATVIKALQGQSDAVATEFGKLPATVARAMTNLSTAFSAYVGEADKAGGYTTKLAGTIDFLAGNLSNVATLLIHTGEVVGAMKLLSMAQDWITASAAIKSAAVATETATVKTVISTAAKIQNTTATVANTAAQATNAAAWNDVAAKLGGVGPKLATAGEAATVAAGKFGIMSTAVGGLMRAFGPLLALDVATHFKEYGTWLGEAAAKMMGYKDRTDELTAAEIRAAAEADANATAHKQQAAALKEAADRSFGLTKEGSALVGKFDEMRTKGDSASAAIASIGKDFDLSNIPGIKTAAGVLDKLAADGKLSASEVQVAWAQALKGEDLAAFETKAMAAFRGTSREAERTAQVLDASLREAIKRAGLDFVLVSGGMSKASVSAINDTQAMIDGLDRLKSMGVDTARSLTASLGKSIETADSQKALDTIKTQIEAVRTALGDKVADGLLDQAKQKADALKDALDAATPGINSAREAMKTLGVVSDQTLKDTASKSKAAFDAMRESGTSSTRELADGFKKYAEDAIAANGGVASEAIKTQAAMQGLQVTTDSTGKTIVSAMNKGKQATDGLTGSADKATSALEKQNAAQEKAIAAQEKANALVQRAIDLENVRLGQDREHFALNTAGQRVSMAVPTQRSVYDQAKSSGLTDNQALNISNQFIQNGQQTGFGNANAAAGENWGTAVQKAIDAAVLSNAGKAAQNNTSIPLSPQQQNTYTVNLNINGQNTPVKVSSQADAQALISALQRAQTTA